MKCRFRLTRSNDLKRVRHAGKSYTHPLVVLYALAVEHDRTRIGVTAGRGVGNAVQRNRAKRLLRAAMRDLLTEVSPGFDLMLIARSPLLGAEFLQVRQALAALLKRAGLIPVHQNG
ncbi:MAG: ribonuclease P protein component [Anaerolineales bacterium]|nr:ribonuclease P protein component [Anaerolineales bacterium]